MRGSGVNQRQKNEKKRMLTGAEDVGAEVEDVGAEVEDVEVEVEGEDVAEVEWQCLQRPKTRTSQSWNGRQAQRKSRLQPSSKLCNVENTRAR